MRLNTKIFTSVSTKSLVFGFVITAACAAFVFTGFGSLNPGNLSGLDPNTIAKVGSEKINVEQFSQVMSSQGLDNSNAPDRRNEVAKQVLNQLIQQKIMDEKAKDIGWIVDDIEIASLIKSVPVFQNPQTQQFDIQLFKNYISQQQMSELSFYAYLKEQLEVQKYQNLLYMPVPVPSALIETQNKIDNSQFKLQYAVVQVPESVIKSKISAETQKYLEDKTNIESLKTLFENTKNQYQQKAQYKALSILISYKDAKRAQGDSLKRNQEDAKKLISQLEDKINKGENFAKIATLTNDDLQAKNNKGSIGMVDESSIDSASLNALSKLTQIKPLSGIVETPFGYRLFKLLEAKPAVSKNFDDVKVQLAEQMVGNQVKAQIDSQLQKNINETLAAKNFSNLNKILTENHITWQYLNKDFKVTDSYIPELGTAQNLSAQIFSLKNPGDTLSSIVDFGTKKAVVKLISKTAPTTVATNTSDKIKNQILNITSAEFSRSTQQALMKDYESKGKIKINTALIN